MGVAGTIAVFMAALAFPFCVRWLKSRRWGERVQIVIDPENPQPAEIARYFAEVARSLDERPRRLRMTICGRNAGDRAISFSVAPDRRLCIGVEGQEPYWFELRGRWIADHPSPLPLRRAVLYVEPVDANRFRVMPAVPLSLPNSVYVAASLLATVGLVWMIPAALAAAVGIAVGGAVSRWRWRE